MRIPGIIQLARLTTCREASHLISQQQDAPLTLGQRWRLRFHLLCCDACRRFVRQAEFLRKAMRRYRM